MTMDEDARPPLKKPRPLDTLSIEELTEYVAELTAETERAQAMIAAKRSHRGAADALFKV